MRVFHNGDVQAQTWYPVIASGRIRRGRNRTVELLGRRLAVYRGHDGKVGILDARCPHLGADLGAGVVRDDGLECPFHAWRFSSSGRCVAIPRMEIVPESAHTMGYPVTEAMGLIWMFNGPEPAFQLPRYPEAEFLGLRFVRWSQPCHYHIVVANGIDMNHWRTVHGFRPESEPIAQEMGNYGFRAQLLLDADRRRPVFAALGLDRLEASITILGGNIALIDVRIPWRLTVMIAHRPRSAGGSQSRLFAFFPRGGALKRWTGAAHLESTARLALIGLLLDDDRSILQRIDFKPGLTSEDRLLASFIQHVNRLPVFGPNRDRMRDTAGPMVGS